MLKKSTSQLLYLLPPKDWPTGVESGLSEMLPFHLRGARMPTDSSQWSALSWDPIINS